MKDATGWIIGFSSEVDYYLPDTSMYQQYVQILAHSTEHRAYGLDGLKDFNKLYQDPPPTKGYLERWAKHKSFYSYYYSIENILISKIKVRRRTSTLPYNKLELSHDTLNLGVAATTPSLF